MSKAEHFMLQVDNDAVNTNGTTDEESHSAKSSFPANSSYQSQQNYSLVTGNWKLRGKRKTYAEALKEDFRNGLKETREGVVSDGERNTGIRDNVSYVNKVID